MKKIFPPIFIPITIAICFASFNFYLISNGHFSEDAYILFVYVENIIRGDGIVFFHGGPPTEGATDFLWLILLVGLGKLGIDTGSSVIFLNAVGVSIIVFWLQRATRGVHKKYVILLFPFLFIWLIQDLIQAAVGGFSVYLYLALILSTFIVFIEGKHLKLLPYLSILIALFRPDGVIIGVGFTLLGAYKTRPAQYKEYARHASICLLIGVIYFVWRYQYFGHLLPLPLYVKGNASQLTAGFNQNLYWVINRVYLLLPFGILGYFSRKKMVYFWGTLPVLALYIALLMATQSQNMGYRFQAPLLIVFYYIFVLFIVEHISQKNVSDLLKKILVISYFCLWTIHGMKFVRKSNTQIMEFNYINQAPQAINKILPTNSTLLITEAGRMAYWNLKGNHKIFDLVGLNTAYPAKHTISSAYLGKKNADLIMIHQGKELDIKWLKPRFSPVIRLTKNDRKYFKSKEKKPLKARMGIHKTVNASYVTIAFLQEHFDQFDIFIVDYNEDLSYSHIYAIAKRLMLSERLDGILKESFQKHTKRSYYEMIETQ